MSDKGQWYNNDAFWEATQRFLFPPERWESAAASVDDLVALLNMSPPAAVLDLCCGPGRFAIPLAAKGFAVTAVDRTQLYLDHLGQRSCEQHLSVEIVASDMRDFVRENAFDAVLNMFTSIGFFEDPADDRKVLQNAHISLRPGGKLILDLASRDCAIAHWQTRDWQECNGEFLLEERELVDDCTRSRNRWIVLRDGRPEKWEFTHWLYGVSELKSLLEQAGFTKVSAFGNLKGEPYTRSSFRLVLVAEK